MPVLKSVSKVIGSIEDWLTILSFIGMTVVVIIIVICRYALKAPFMVGEELARYLMIWCAYSGMAYAFRKKAHVGVVVFVDLMPKFVQKYILHIRRVCTVIVMVALCVFAFMVFNQYLSTNQLTTVMKLPTAFVYIIVPIGLVLGTFHSVVDLVLGFLPEKRQELEGGQ